MVCARRFEVPRLAHMRARKVVGREEPEKNDEGDNWNRNVGTWKHRRGEVKVQVTRRDGIETRKNYIETFHSATVRSVILCCHCAGLSCHQSPHGTASGT